MKKYIAEFLGTFSLSLVVVLSLGGVFPVPTSVLAALTVGLFVYTVGHISGTHINPAVTIGAWSIGKIRTNDVIGYIIAQILAGGFVFIIAEHHLPVRMAITVNSSMLTGLAELIGTFFLTFGIASVVYGRTPGQLSGLVIGGSLLLGV